MIKFKKQVPKTPKSQEIKPSHHMEPFMDTKVEMHDLFYSYHLSDLCFNLYDYSMKIEDPFRVIELGLYHKISPIV